MVKRSLILFVGIFLINLAVFAVDVSPKYEDQAKQSKADQAQQSQSEGGGDGTPAEKIIEEYKTFAAGVSPEIRNEIIAYRKEVAKINKQKRELYQKLSEGAQGYLAKEQEYRKRLPLKQKKLIKIPNQNEKIGKVE